MRPRGNGIQARCAKFAEFCHAAFTFRRGSDTMSGMSSPWNVIIVVALCLIAIVALALVVRASYRRRQVRQAHGREDDSRGSYAFVINPSKPGAEMTREFIKQYCTEHHIPRPMIIETQLDRDGGVCAQEALDRGAQVVVAVGGDGTVRTVARAMAGTGHAMGIVPIGTGNLFARNIGVPLGNLRAAMAVATSHGSRTVDVGYMQLLDSSTPEYKHPFLIIAGVGFDGDMIDDTNPKLKKSISWLAYFAGAIKHLFQQKAKGTVTFVDTEGHKHMQADLQFRTMMAGNCGQIPGFSLMPEAIFDDGRLDFEMIDTSGGMIGWMNLFSDVVHQTVVKKAKQSPFSTNSTVEQFQGLEATLTLDHPQTAEVDGDILGKTRYVHFGIEPRALIVRVPSLPEGDATGVMEPLSHEQIAAMARLRGGASTGIGVDSTAEDANGDAVTAA